ncbi:MAG: lytic transglycosylase domain-containing protein [Clostridia bacterium]|nr:lytic transglycosylase domain-containing protein [Clostridia bacterium]
MAEYTKDQIKNVLIPKWAAFYGVPLPIAMALIKQESGFNPKAVSKVGAKGLGQLMPATAKSYGVSDPFDADTNLNASFHLLSGNYKRFGRWDWALAAYNAGGGNVKKYGGIPPFKETQNYVKSISAMAGIDKLGRFIGHGHTQSYSLIDNAFHFIDPDTGNLKFEGLNQWVKGLKKNIGPVNLTSIQTNRPELLEDKPEYAEFAVFRNMKNSKGQPLFVKGDKDSFEVNIANNGMNPLSDIGTNEIAKDMVATQASGFLPISTKQAAGLFETFKDRYTTGNENSYGLAGLTPGEYMDYGMMPNEMDDPILQARVLTQEYQRAEDVLGNERKAVYALGGGDMVDEEGNVKSWKDIKAQDDAYLKQWRISPSKDEQTRKRMNTLMAVYKSARDNFEEV